MTTTHAPDLTAGERFRAAWRAIRHAFVGALKLFLVAAVTAGVVVGFGSPLWGRHDLNGVAKTAARAGAQSVAVSSDLSRARAAAARVAEAHHAGLDGFVLSATEVKVTVTRHAPSLGLDRIFSSWYDVRVTASAAPH